MLRRILRLVRIVALALPLAPLAFAASPAPWLTRIWSLDALGTRNVSGVAVSPDGFLWVATHTGVLRFDGSTFTRYPGWQLNRGAELRFDHLAANTTDLWVAADHGRVIQFSGTHVLHYGGMPQAKSDGLCLDHDGAAWVTYPNGEVWRLQHGDARRLGPAEGIGDGAVALAADRGGNIWIAQNGTLMAWRDDRFVNVARIPGPGRIVLAAARDGGLWLAVGNTLYSSSADGTVTPVAANVTAVQSPIELMLDDGSGLWLATHLTGLYRLEHGGTTVTSVPVSYRYIDGLAVDPFGDVWIATMGGGLNQLQRRVFTVEGGASGLPAEAIQSLCEDTTGTLWGVTQSNRIVIRQNDSWQPAPAPAIDDVTCVAADPRGGIWIGTRDQRLYAWRNGTLATFGADQGLACANVYAVLPCANADVWLTGARTNGVYRLRGGRFTRLPLPNPKYRPMEIVQDETGTIWVGTLEGLLYRVAGDRLVEETACRQTGQHHVIRSLRATSHGVILGYEGAGLGWLKDGRFATFGADGAFGTRNIQAVAEDAAGWLWCGTERGVFAVPESRLEKAGQNANAALPSVLFGTADGLTDLTTTGVETTGAMRTRDGRIWMPIGSALVIIDPAKANLAVPPRHLYLTRVIVDRQTIAEYDSPLSNALTPRISALPHGDDDGITLEPGRSIEVDFSCPNLARPNAATLRYRLDGFDETWTDAPATHAVTFAHLSPGHYRFEVQAIDPATRDRMSADLAFVVAPHLWETWWFEGGMLALFTGSVIAGVRAVSYRRLRHKMAKLKREAELDRERTRIARDIHDDVGTVLTRILLLSKLAQRDPGHTRETDEHLTAISRSAEEVAGALDEIVWAVNPRNDTLSHLVDYLANFAVEFLRAAGIECRLELPDRVPDDNVAADIRHSFLLVVKEALNNVARHSAATAATLRVELSDTAVTAIVSDNGRGFAGDPTKPGSDGLANMRERMQELGGRCEIASAPGTGTRVTLVWPRRQPGTSRQF